MHPRSKCLVILFLADFLSAHKQCVMPDRNTGECRPLKECNPLKELNSKRRKTYNDVLYIGQSVSSCGTTSSFEMVVCCPPKPLWGKLRTFKPILYNEIITYNTELLQNYDESNLIKPDDSFLNNDTLRKETSRGQSIVPKYKCGTDYEPHLRIKGGSATSINQYPWLILLDYENNETRCGGSLITTRYVLTAAHCIIGIEPKFARLAEYNITSYPTDFIHVADDIILKITVDRVSIERNIPHPNYTRQYLHHDIGLSKLSRDAVLSQSISIICLPDQDMLTTFREPTIFTIAGWGTDGVKRSDVKKQLNVPFVPLDKCKLAYRYRQILKSQICAGGKLGEDSCRGDSGGPLMYMRDSTFMVVGVISYGLRKCGTENIPAVHTYVYSYLDWLRDNMV